MRRAFSPNVHHNIQVGGKPVPYQIFSLQQEKMSSVSQTTVLFNAGCPSLSEDESSFPANGEIPVTISVSEQIHRLKYLAVWPM